MAKSIYGFSDQRTPEILKSMISNGLSAARTPVEIYPTAKVMFNKIWWATAKAEISAATQGDVATGTFTCASGQVYILELNRTTGKFDYVTTSDGTKVERKLWNPHDSKIKVSTKIVFPIYEDRYSNYWPTGPLIYKPWCRFTLDSALTTSDVYKDATIEEQWGYGFDHPSVDINVYNFKIHTPSTYMFTGDSGDYGYASYDPQNDKWWINPMECP